MVFVDVLVILSTISYCGIPGFLGVLLPLLRRCDIGLVNG
jgi:hypothetical protein